MSGEKNGVVAVTREQIETRPYWPGYFLASLYLWVWPIFFALLVLPTPEIRDAGLLPLIFLPVFFICGLTNSAWLNWLLHLRPALRPKAMVRINAYGLPLIFLPFCTGAGNVSALATIIPSLVVVIGALAAGQFLGRKLIVYIAQVHSGRRSPIFLKSISTIVASFVLNFAQWIFIVIPLMFFAISHSEWVAFSAPLSLKVVEVVAAAIVGIFFALINFLFLQASVDFTHTRRGEKCVLAGAFLSCLLTLSALTVLASVTYPVRSTGVYGVPPLLLIMGMTPLCSAIGQYALIRFRRTKSKIKGDQSEKLEPSADPSVSIE
ncbi:MAG: hypothetical protein KGS72_01380 [Cyanobacteria bacterium REEB67]|nr:hypothetical protein [Cyanobacteria bacterium REEB67]